jgi:hypothetical protein
MRELVRGGIKVQHNYANAVGPIAQVRAGLFSFYRDLTGTTLMPRIRAPADSICVMYCHCCIASLHGHVTGGDAGWALHDGCAALRMHNTNSACSSTHMQLF